jgi:hypothetical protein
VRLAATHGGGGSGVQHPAGQRFQRVSAALSRRATLPPGVPAGSGRSNAFSAVASASPARVSSNPRICHNPSMVGHTSR